MSAVLHRIARIITELASLARLPFPVARFYLRLYLRAQQLEDQFAIWASSRPRELAALLQAARGSRQAVEVGTGAGWTALSLALALPECTVTTFDPVDRDHRADYFAVAGPSVRARVTYVPTPAEEATAPAAGVDLLFIDGMHDREATVTAFGFWSPRLAPGAVIAFHDFGDPSFPGVQEAVAQLRLKGTAHGRLFVCHAPA